VAGQSPFLSVPSSVPPQASGAQFLGLADLQSDDLVEIISQGSVLAVATLANLALFLQGLGPAIPLTETISAGGTFQLDSQVEDVLVQLALAANVNLTLPEGTKDQRLSVMDGAGTAGTNRIHITAPVGGILNGLTGASAFTDIRTPYGWTDFKCVVPGTWIIAG
jgi:hypothetical protein